MILNRFDGITINEKAGFGIGLEILTSGGHEVDGVKTIANLLELRRKHYSDGVMVVDCGANIGTHTIPWAHQMTGWGLVLAIEPQERIYYALCGNIALNNCFNARALHPIFRITRL